MRKASEQLKERLKDFIESKVLYIRGSHKNLIQNLQTILPFADIKCDASDNTMEEHVVITIGKNVIDYVFVWENDGNFFPLLKKVA